MASLTILYKDVQFALVQIRGAIVKFSMRTFSLPHTHWHPELDYNAFCQCASEYTGNFYDFIPQNGGGLAVCFGDLPSSGEGQAINVPCLEALVRGLGVETADMAWLARELNTTLHLLGPRGLCVPWFYARIHPASRQLQYVNAGHEPPLLIRSGGTVERLERTGAALGLSTRGTHRRKTASIDAGDVLAIFSEAVPEDTVRRVVLENPHSGTAELSQRVLEECRGAGEDRTFAAVRVLGAWRHPLVEECAEVALCAA